MEATEFLKDKIDIVKVMEHYDFDKIKERGTSVRSCCKLHGGNNPTGFFARTDNNLWYCHTGDCGGGDIYSLVQRIEDVPFLQAVHIVAELFHVDISNMQITEPKVSYKEEVKKWIHLMRNKSKVKTTPYEVDVPMRDVNKFRNFDSATIEHFGMKYIESIELESRDGKIYTLKNRLFFPITENGVQIGASLRRTKSSDVPKWSHQPASLNVSQHLYNSDALIGATEIVICEGTLDVWAWHEVGHPAVATFGAHVTEEQYRILLRSGADLIWSFDGDKAGTEATEKAVKLFKYKANQYVIPFGEGEDPENITREELVTRYEQRKRKI